MYCQLHQITKLLRFTDFKRYTPFEITAEELLRKWAAWIEESHPSGIVPIFWSACGESRHETLPGTIIYYDEPYEQEDFLDFFSPPIRCDTGEPLRWIDLPVRDRAWSLERNDKGGFIQEATGWKPSIFQAFVLVDHLFNFDATNRVRGGKEVWEFQRSLMPEVVR